MATHCLSDDERAALVERFGGCCAYCRAPLTHRIQMEHVEPLSRGGADVPENIVPSCGSCNGSKHNMFLLEWVFMVHGLLVCGTQARPLRAAEPRPLRPHQRHWRLAAWERSA